MQTSPTHEKSPVTGRTSSEGRDKGFSSLPYDSIPQDKNQQSEPAGWHTLHFDCSNCARLARLDIKKHFRNVQREGKHYVRVYATTSRLEQVLDLLEIEHKPKVGRR